MVHTRSRLVPYLRRLSTPPQADAELLERFVHHHDEAAFTLLVERHGPMVLHTCERVLGDVHTAQDAFQAAFLVLARRARSLGRLTSLAGWLHGVAQRVALKARGARLRAGRTMALADQSEPADPRPDPLAALSAREVLVLVEEEVRRLPEAYRLAVVLCCLEGLTLEEAARRLGATAGSVKGCLERGRARLYKAWPAAASSRPGRWPPWRSRARRPGPRCRSHCRRRRSGPAWRARQVPRQGERSRRGPRSWPVKLCAPCGFTSSRC